MIIGGIPNNNNTTITTNNNLYIGGIRFTQATFNTTASLSAAINNTASVLADANGNISLCPFTNYIGTGISVPKSNVVLGVNNTLSNTCLSNIIAGYGNLLTSSTSNVIEGGSSTLQNTSNCVIIGYSQAITGCMSSVFINASPSSYTNYSNTLIIGNSALISTTTGTTLCNLTVANTLSANTLSGLSSINLTNSWSIAPTTSNYPSGGSTTANVNELVFSNTTSRFKISSYLDTTVISFTGIHRCVVKEGLHTPFPGALMCATGIIKNLTENDMEAIPVVEVSTQPYDKCVFGVFNVRETPTEDGWRSFTIGNMVLEHPANDVRSLINSTGEGAIYTVGPVEIGDLLCSSMEPGVAMAQQDDIVRSYTAAKATESLPHGVKRLIGCIYLL